MLAAAGISELSSRFKNGLCKKEKYKTFGWLYMHSPV